MIATIAPLFIPYVGQAYGIATASAYFGQALAVFGKTVIDAIGDDTASKSQVYGNSLIKSTLQLESLILLSVMQEIKECLIMNNSLT